MGRWRDLFSGVGQAALDVAGAEVEELRGDLAKTAKGLARVGIAAFVAAGLAFYTLGLLTFFLVALFALRWPLWQATLAASGILALAGLVAAAIAYLWLRKLESPARTVQRRLEDHLGWWQEEILSEADAATARRSASEEDEEETP